MYVTQDRKLHDAVNTIRVQTSAATGLEVFLTAPVAVQPSQTTYSWRTGRAQNESDEDLVNDWMTVTRNGFESPYDTGHDFFTTKTSHRFSHPRWLDRWTYQGQERAYSGPLVPYISGSPDGWGTYPALSRLTDEEKLKWGSDMINQTNPTKPSASLAQFGGELRQLPRLVGSGLMAERANVYRGLGSEYLNVQFGWMPFVSDLQKMTDSLLRSTEILRQFERNSGRVVRRRRVAPDIVTSNLTQLGYVSTTPLVGTTAFKGNYSSVANPVELSIEDIKRETFVFSGAYTYHIPSPDGFWNKMERFEQQANLLLGTRLTPSVLWELAPWSWLIDWHGQIGSVVSNASALAGDELVLRYGYLQKMTLQQRTYRLTPIVFNNGKSTGPIQHTLRRVTKERVKANPYGFTLSPSSYSSRQWAILGALGMTKAPRVLR